MPIERDRLAGALAAAYCDGIASCCQQAGIAFTDAICQTAAMASASAKFIDWNPPSTNYDSAAAGRCRDALAVAAAACSGLEQMNVLDNCYDIFSGTQPPGGRDTCAGPNECLSGFCDFSTADAGAGDAGVQQGVCANKVFVTADTCGGIFM